MLLPQAITGRHSVLSRSMALRVTIILRITAKSTSWLSSRLFFLMTNNRIVETLAMRFACANDLFAALLHGH